ncbi:MAG TPA: ATP-binding protein [Acidimicrobiia bacterium]|nr:ATP-binding protein [Acidimicrobiia bacterium]
MKRRLLFSYLSITAFVLLVLEIPLGVSYANSVERRLTSDLQHDAFSLAIRSQEPLDRADAGAGAAETRALQALADRYHSDAGGRVVIMDAHGRSVADSDTSIAIGRDFSTRPEVRQALGGAEVSGTRSSATLGTKLLYVALPVGSAGGIQGAVRITYPASVIDDQIRHIWLLLAATGGVVLGIVFLVSLLLSGSMTRPLADLETAAGALGAGDLSARAEVPKGPAELTVLAESFNATAARLEQLVGAQRGFVADASHQLRTPLAAMRLRLENLEADVDGAAAEDLEGALAEVSRLSRLVDGLLVLMRAEQSTSDPAPVVVEDVLDGRCDAWDAFAAEKHVQIDASVAGTPVASATPGRLEQVVDNLLNNALEVAPPGSAVRVVAGSVGDWVELRVSDAGPGMSAEERAHAFERFWQSGEARRDGRPNGHFGLGLSIVRELVVGDGGDVALAPSDTGGLEVVVRMKRSDAAVAPRARQLSTASAT